MQSLQCSALLMRKADPETLKQPSIIELWDEMQNSHVGLLRRHDGVLDTYDKASLVRLMIESLAAKIAAEPPETVTAAVVERTRLVKHAPRANDTAIAALATSLKDRAASFAARGPEEAKKVTADLPPLPKRDAATVAEREQEYAEWTRAAPADRAAVWSRIPFDSHQYGCTEPLQEYPLLRGWPTIVSDPTATTTMEALAKALAHGEKLHRRRNAAAEESGEEGSD